MNKKIIGVDIGGTTIKIGFINQQGKIIKKWEINTNKTNSKHIPYDIWKSIQQELGKQQLTEQAFSGIGIGSQVLLMKSME